MVSAIIFSMGHQSTDNKSKNKQVGLYQNKKLLHIKRNKNVKREPIEWVKIFTNHISVKELIAMLCKDFLQFKISFLKNNLTKMNKGLE
jgi:hypothetical protein